MRISLQHSASTTMSSNAAVGSQKPAPIGSGGSSSYGPIGSTTFSQAAPGPPFPSGNVKAQPEGPQGPGHSPPVEFLGPAIMSRQAVSRGSMQLPLPPLRAELPSTGPPAWCNLLRVSVFAKLFDRFYSHKS